MDSVTRFAHAQRQIGLSVGEPPATKGFTPSVFAGMASLLERAGAVREEGESGQVAEWQSGKAIASAQEGSGTAPALSATLPLRRSATSPRAGSITGLYTILVDGDDMTEPISDAARGILDGHIILSRRLAQRAHYPAIDVLDSVSRVADDVCDRPHIDSRRQILRLMATYRDVEDLVQIGAYAPGTNPEADVAIEYRPRIVEMLQQGRDEVEPFEQARSRLVKTALESGEALRRRLHPKGGAR
jgi:flagellum-specific ATP synthase